MKLLNNTNYKWILMAAFIACSISAIPAQNTKVDTLVEVKSNQKQCPQCQPAKAGSEAKIKSAPVSKAKKAKKKADVSECFANGFLFKRNTLSDI